jgi:hypothetical protein
MRVTIKDSGDLKAISKQLRTVTDGKQLRKELTGGMRDALRPAVTQVKAAYLAQPGFTGKRSRSRARQPDLRTLLAKSVRLEVRLAGRMAGARIRADGRRMPPGMRALPRYWEGEGRPWRHPIFGHRGGLSALNRWVAQPSRPTFYRTVEPHEPQIRRQIDAVFERVRRKLEGR